VSRFESLFPQEGATIEAVAERLKPVFRPFDPEVVDFLDALSRDLFKLTRVEPALAPLAFFIRRSNLVALADDASARVPAGAIASPQGAVLHVPPTNVDTLFLYTLAISLLTGNANVVRISKNAGPATHRILDLLIARLREHPSVARAVTIIQFDRDKDLLDTLSRLVDVRMIWGGDATVHAIRESRLSPFGKDLAFPDRVSLAALSVSAWLEADDATKTSVVEGLYNDTFWFDQMACSSPVQLILTGGTDAQSREVESDLARRLAEVADVRYQDVDGQAINKMVDLIRGIDRGLSGIDWVSNSVVTARGAELSDAVSLRPGGGFFTVQHVDDLLAVAAQVTRRVQTLSTFGYGRDELVALAESANGRGIDRIVPIGHALDFAVVWDGMDLVSELLRLTTVDA